jgi:glycosyltransferase involved in cell wall biosynthesis
MNVSDNNYYPFITIVVPVRNEEHHIGELLSEIVKQDYPIKSFEVIVADGFSEDATREIVQQFASDHPQISLVSNEGRLSSFGRNIGFRKGKGDIFLVIDGHCKINSEYLLKNVAECFRKSGAHCLGRPQPFVLPEEPNIQKAIGFARSSWLGHNFNSHIHNDKEGYLDPVSCGCAYRRDVFSLVGYVDEVFDACEDVEFNYRIAKAGLISYFSPSIALYYHPRDSIKSLWKQLIRYGKGRSRLLFKHPGTLNTGIVLSQLYVMALILGPFTIFISNIFFMGWVLGLILYLCVLLIQSLRIKKDHSFIFALKIGLVFIVIHSSIGVGILIGTIENSFRVIKNFFRKIRLNVLSEYSCD